MTIASCPHTSRTRMREDPMFISTEEDFEEPVTLEGLKAYLALRDADRPDDSYLKGLVTTARGMLEDEGGLERVIVPRSFELSFS